MKKEILSSVLLSVLCIIAFAGIYPLAVWGIAQAAPGRGNGFTITAGDKKYYTNIAQKFTDDGHFWSRPSAVNYNAAGSGGSNKGPDNPEYLLTVKQRIDTFMAHNPHVQKGDIPSDMVTASGSGLDPHISVQGATVQIDRIAHARHIPAEAVQHLVDINRERPFAGFMGPEKVNVLKLNIALDNIK